MREQVRITPSTKKKINQDHDHDIDQKKQNLTFFPSIISNLCVVQGRTNDCKARPMLVRQGKVYLPFLFFFMCLYSRNADLTRELKVCNKDQESKEEEVKRLKKIEKDNKVRQSVIWKNKQIYLFESFIYNETFLFGDIRKLDECLF